MTFIPLPTNSQLLSDMIKRSHISDEQYNHLKFIVEQSNVALGEKMSLMQQLNEKFSR